MQCMYLLTILSVAAGENLRFLADVPLPGGPFQATCTSCYVANGDLVCDLGGDGGCPSYLDSCGCLDRQGISHAAVLKDYATCEPGSIDNQDGKLVCQQRFLPEGPYSATCGERCPQCGYVSCTVTSTDLKCGSWNPSGGCLNRAGSCHTTVLKDYATCEPNSIKNQDGNLVCQRKPPKPTPAPTPTPTPTPTAPVPKGCADDNSDSAWLSDHSCASLKSRGWCSVDRQEGAETRNRCRVSCGACAEFLSADAKTTADATPTAPENTEVAMAKASPLVMAATSILVQGLDWLSNSLKTPNDKCIPNNRRCGDGYPHCCAGLVCGYDMKRVCMVDD